MSKQRILNDDENKSEWKSNIEIETEMEMEMEIEF
jgi:hypothetical protein